MKYMIHFILGVNGFLIAFQELEVHESRSYWDSLTKADYVCKRVHIQV